MTTLASFIITQRGRGNILVTNLCSAKAAAESIQQRRAFENDKELMRIVEMIDQAMSGYQIPAVAFNAFAKWADAKGLVTKPEKSRALEDFYEMVGEIRQP